jgi:hypothetical protein
MGSYAAMRVGKRRIRIAVDNDRWPVSFRTTNVAQKVTTPETSMTRLLQFARVDVA